MVGTHCYTPHRGPKRDRQPRWVPAAVTTVFGTCPVSVLVVPREPIWRRHIDQLRPRYRTNEAAGAGEMSSSLATPDEISTEVDTPMNDALP